MQIIRNRAIVEDDFVHVPDGAELPDGKPIVTLARYVAAREELLARYPSSLGVRIASDKLPTDIPDLTKLALIAIEFPRFTDGRGYSVARMLRDRYKFTGELRAVGYVKRDQLFFLARCGFDAFELSPGVDPQAVLTAFDDFDVSYQPATTSTREQRHFYVHGR